MKPAERGPGGGLTATYCTPFERSLKSGTPPVRNGHSEAEDGVLEASWGPLGRLLGASWGLPWASGGLLGASWGPLGGLLGRLGASWAHLGSICVISSGWHAKRKRHGAVLGASWGRLGPPLGPPWGHLGASGGLRGPSWGRLGAVLGPSWGHPGPIWGPS